MKASQNALASADKVNSSTPMPTLSASYLFALASQFGSLSAFLGGFAATSLVTLVVLGRRSGCHTAAIVLSAIAAAGFIVAVVASSMVIALLNVSAPRQVTAISATLPQMVMTLMFGLSTFALIGAIGCCGWLHSRAVGLTTGAIGGVAALLVLTLTVRVN